MEILRIVNFICGISCTSRIVLLVIRKILFFYFLVDSFRIAILVSYVIVTEFEKILFRLIFYSIKKICGIDAIKIFQLRSRKLY